MNTENQEMPITRADNLRIWEELKASLEQQRKTLKTQNACMYYERDWKVETYARLMAGAMSGHPLDIPNGHPVDQACLLCEMMAETVEQMWDTMSARGWFEL
jgi:hypothetical protein